ncbi:hypothetical protein ACHAW6_005587 [Cyclotella cf. meneghiniana]
MMQLRTPAYHTHILPALSSNSLLIGIFADNGYITIFHDGNKGATIHDDNDMNITSSCPAIFQGWQDDKGLWHIPLTKPHSILHDPALPCINHVYDLPSMALTVHYLHAALGFPTKTTLLSVIRNGNLTTFPRLIAANEAKHFPKSNETQKVHMKQIQQGL